VLPPKLIFFYVLDMTTEDPRKGAMTSREPSVESTASVKSTQPTPSSSAIASVELILAIAGSKQS